MSPRPLALSDEQLQLVVTAARSVLPAWRSRFLSGVADQLLHQRLTAGAVTTTDVRHALTLVLARISGGQAA